MVRVVVIVAVILAIGVPAVAAPLWALRRYSAAPGRVVSMPGKAPESSYLGGSLSARWSVAWPLARLEFFDWGVRLAGSVRAVRWLTAPWEARYEQLAAVRLISSPATGVRFAVKESTDAWSSGQPGSAPGR